MESSGETQVEGSPAGEAAEAGGETQAEATPTETHSESGNEPVLGIEIESTAFVVLAFGVVVLAGPIAVLHAAAAALGIKLARLASRFRPEPVRGLNA